MGTQCTRTPPIWGESSANQQIICFSKQLEPEARVMLCVNHNSIKKKKRAFGTILQKNKSQNSGTVLLCTAICTYAAKCVYYHSKSEFYHFSWLLAGNRGWRNSRIFSRASTFSSKVGEQISPPYVRNGIIQSTRSLTV